MLHSSATAPGVRNGGACSGCPRFSICTSALTRPARSNTKVTGIAVPGSTACLSPTSVICIAPGRNETLPLPGMSSSSSSRGRTMPELASSSFITASCAIGVSMAISFSGTRPPFSKLA
jgi:hypothetical protein